MEVSPTEEAGPVAPRADWVPPGEEEAILGSGRRLLADPKVRARVDEILAEMRRGGSTEPGITAEELPTFLREHGL